MTFGHFREVSPSGGFFRKYLRLRRGRFFLKGTKGYAFHPFRRTQGYRPWPKGLRLCRTRMSPKPEIN
jgi:hypothetical protein